MRRLPRFSFVIPLYNSEPEFLGVQLAAVARQTYPFWQCVLIDDGSADRQAAHIASRWAHREPRGCLIQQPCNGGIAAATNAGLDVVTGDFVVFSDHDDVVNRRALEHIAGALVGDPRIDILYTDEEMIDAKGRFLTEYPKPDFDPVRILSHNYFNHLTVMRRSVLGELRLRSDHEPSQDFDLVLRMLRRSQAVAHLPRSLYSWRAAPGSVALSIDEKPNVRRSVHRSASAALTERGLDADIEPVRDDPGAVRLRPRGEMRGHLVSVTLPLTASLAEFDRAVAAVDAELVAVMPDGCSLPAHQLSLLGLLAENEGAAATGPMIVDRQGVILSAGRAHSPDVHDMGALADIDNGGPSGAFNITRRVSSVAPWGSVISTAAWQRYRPANMDLCLDAAFAAWCTTARGEGTPVLWTPLVQLSVPYGWRPLSRVPGFDSDIVALAATTPGLLREVHTPITVDA